MTVTVLLFAAHREAAGTGSVRLEVPDASTVEEAYRLLQSEHPRLGALRPFTTFAVNREVVEASAVLQPGDEVALLQPVSGGCQ